MKDIDPKFPTIFTSLKLLVKIHNSTEARSRNQNTIQWSLYFTTTKGTIKMWSYTAVGLKTQVQIIHKAELWDQIMWSYNQGDLEIKVVK